MAATSRQSNIILNQDWTRIYQTFSNADFKSYDFENLRRVIITYLRENYPEDFNDYIESSEYMALIDAIAFLGQSLAFRIDLASRENFIELANRRESVLRLAKMLSYSVKRNRPAAGLLKFTSVSTTEDLVDSNGRNLAQQTVSWNDPTNLDWFEQFISIVNSAMDNNFEFGRSEESAVIQGIPTDQYRLNSIGNDVPIFSFSKAVAGRKMAFEIVSTGLKDQEEIVEEPPVPGNKLGFIYRNDSNGAGSANTGFFLHFRQGSLELADFVIETPTPNETVAVESPNINNDDVWLYKLDSNGNQIEEWSQVPALVGNNIAYNSISKNIRNIYSVETKEEDRVDLVFADGVYGNLPQGAFRVFYRVSNGLSYAIAPTDLRGINISIPYLNKQGVRHTLSIGLALQTTVTSASQAETTDAVRVNAPAQYYTQNRMITAEDYQLLPLTSSQDILKAKSVNRTSSGISRNYDLIDASGKYSAISVFADDGYIFKRERLQILNFKFSNRIEIINFIKRNIEPIFSLPETYNFYLTKFNKILFPDDSIVWENFTTEPNLSSGVFKSDGLNQKVGQSTTSNLKYLSVGALIKFIPPTGYAFKRNQLVEINANDTEQTDRIWVKAVRIFGDGSNVQNTGVADQGPVVFNSPVPTGAIADQVVPKFEINIPDELELEIANLMLQDVNFGLRYDPLAARWKLISFQNIDLISPFSLGRAGDISNSNLDSSWVFAFVKQPTDYQIQIRAMDYVFGSRNQNRFYFDTSQRSFNDVLGKVVRDKTKILGINFTPDRQQPLSADIDFEIYDTLKFADGFESTNEVKIAFSDIDNDGVVDNPDAFEQIVGPDSVLSFLFFKQDVDEFGNDILRLLDNEVENIQVFARESQVDINDTSLNDGQLFYFYDTLENRFKRLNLTTNTLDLESSYSAAFGRDKIKFQYIHNAAVDRRIDPSVTNILDVYLLTRSYDSAYRVFLSDGIPNPPEPPSIDSLRLSYGSRLAEIKSISDEIIYHSASYKVLFGEKASPEVRAKFKIVKNPEIRLNDNDLKVRIINAVNEFFNISNWDFGDRFYIGELTAYIINKTSPDVSNVAIVPQDSSQPFGGLFEIQSGPNEILISGATVDDVEIVNTLSVIEVNTK